MMLNDIKSVLLKIFVIFLNCHSRFITNRCCRPGKPWHSPGRTPINIIAFSSVCWVGIVAHISEPMLLYTNKTSTLFSATKAFESNGRCPVKSQSFSRGDYYLAGGNRVTKGAVQQTFYDLGRLLTTQDNCPVQ